MKLTYTADDAVQLDDGRWAIVFTLPSGNTQYEVTASSASYAADTVNKQIRLCLNQMDAEQPYRDAVKALSTMCLEHGGSGAYAAAQVLLSTYNGNNYQVDLTDLCNLDEENFSHAIAVIRGRVLCSREPHNMIENGSEIFSDLEQIWARINTRNRYKNYYK